MDKFKKNWHVRTLAVTISSLVALSSLFTASYTSNAVTVSSADTSVTNSASFSTDVVYQIVTDRFSDGDSSNNPTGSIYDKSNIRMYHGGDWAGITQKLNENYFTNLGVTALWISPPVENTSFANLDTSSNQMLASYHGYWAKDFFKTNPYFGSESDLKTLIDTAHSKNIKVILDFVPNHTSATLTNEDDGALYQNGSLVASYHNDPNNIFNHAGGFPDTGYTDWDNVEDITYRNLYGLGDLNQLNTTTDSYLKSAANKWLDLGFDGIRIDAVKHMPYGWDKSLMSSVYSHKPVFTFGEYYSGSTGDDSYMDQFANDCGMNLMEFRLSNALRNVISGSGTMKDYDSVVTTTSSQYNHVNDEVSFVDDQDEDRLDSLSGGNHRKDEEAYVLLLTSRGVPSIYYGSEQYMDGCGDPYCRGDMTSFNQSSTAYQVISKLAPLHKSNPALAYGTTKQRWMNDDVYVYERQFGNNVVLTAVNRNQNTSYNIAGLSTSMPAGTYSDVLGGLLGGNGITVGSAGAVNSFTLGAGEAAVWQYTSNSYAAPTIGNVGPYVGAPGNTVTIDGRDFGTTPGTVYFGTTAATVVSWGDSEIKVQVPSTTAGYTGVKVVNSSSVSSNIYSNFEVLTGQQVPVRFIVNNATTAYGTNVYLVGSCFELGNWNTSRAIGPLFNATPSIASYPNWFYDVSVPAGTNIEYKFIMKDASGNVTWESGNNHTLTTPSSGTATVSANW